MRNGEFNRPTFPASNITAAQKIEFLFDGLFDSSWRQTAVATCRFQFQGPKSVGALGKKKNWGEWIRTRMQTGGTPPNGYGFDREYACQNQTNTWVSLDCHQVVCELLECVGLSIDDVYEEFGKPEPGQKYVVDLITIVSRLTNLLSENSVAIA